MRGLPMSQRNWKDARPARRCDGFCSSEDFQVSVAVVSVGNAIAPLIRLLDGECQVLIGEGIDIA